MNSSLRQLAHELVGDERLVPRYFPNETHPQGTGGTHGPLISAPHISWLTESLWKRPGFAGLLRSDRARISVFGMSLRNSTLSRVPDKSSMHKQPRRLRFHLRVWDLHMHVTDKSVRSLKHYTAQILFSTPSSAHVYVLFSNTKESAVDMHLQTVSELFHKSTASKRRCAHTIFTKSSVQRNGLGHCPNIWVNLAQTHHKTQTQSKPRALAPLEWMYPWIVHLDLHTYIIT